MRTTTLRQVIFTSFLLPAAFIPACKREQSRTAAPSGEQQPTPGAAGERDQSQQTPAPYSRQPETSGAAGERGQPHTTPPSSTQSATPGATGAGSTTPSASQPATPGAFGERDSSQTTTPSTSQPSTPGATGERDQSPTTPPTGSEQLPAGAGTDEAQPSTSETTPGGATSGASTTMGQGQTIDASSLKAPQVRALQTALRAQGAKIQVDGRMGPQTRQALEAFQKRHRLGRVGQLDMATLTALELRPQDFMTAH